MKFRQKIFKLENYKRFYHFYFLNKDISVTNQYIKLRFSACFLSSFRVRSWDLFSLAGGVSLNNLMKISLVLVIFFTGGVDGRGSCCRMLIRMSILRNGNVALSNLKNSCVDFKKRPCRMLLRP